VFAGSLPTHPLFAHMRIKDDDSQVTGLLSSFVIHPVQHRVLETSQQIPCIAEVAVRLLGGSYRRAQGWRTMPGLAAGSRMGGAVVVEAVQRHPLTYMTLAEDPLGQVVAADWIGKLVMLGRLAARWSRAHADSQLVVVLSLPVRDFAAVLVACGWMTATAPPSIPPVSEVLAGLPLHAPVRVVTRSKVLAEHFGGVNAAKGRARFGTDWQIDKLRAVVLLDSLDTPRSQSIPKPGVISKLTGMDKDWSARLCRPPQDLALFGTRKWLEEDVTAFLGRGDERELIADILLPVGPRVATWSTRILPTSRLDEEPLLSGVRAVVLDGAAPTKYLAAMEAPVVISIIDRSIADESAPEWVINYRNVRGEPVSLERDLHWKPPVGVEVLGFEMPL
jgi:hypothetical protein